MDGNTPALQLPQRPATPTVVSKPLYKFLIGFTAGFCAAIFPRLTAMLLIPADGSGLSFFSFGYLMYSCLFAGLIGVVVMIMEWRVAKEPRTTFMAALGIPAIITGSLNTLDGATALDAQLTQNERLVNELEKSVNIDVLHSDRFRLLTPTEHDDNGPLGFHFITPAHAANGELPQEQSPRFRISPSIQPAPHSYLIVLDKLNTRSAAIARAQELSQRIPAQAIVSDQGYLVVKQGTFTNKADSLLEALRLREKFDIHAEVLELR